MSAKNNTQVIIAGKIYTLSGYESGGVSAEGSILSEWKDFGVPESGRYLRLSPEMRSILPNLNTADDYFKVKKKVEELERELSEKDQEIYEFKHEMITAQIRIENAEKEAKALEERNAQLQKELVRLEAQRDA